MATVYGREVFKAILKPMARKAVVANGKEIQHDAELILEMVRATSTSFKPSDYEHKYEVGGYEDDSDYVVYLDGPNPMALEYGHNPSGLFAGTETKAPEGRHILGNAVAANGGRSRK